MIDTHVHVWTADTQRYPLAHTPPRGLRPVEHFGPETILDIARPCGIERIVLIQMSFYGYDNRFMLDTVAADPATFRGVAVIDPRGADAGDRLHAVLDAGAIGLRLGIGVTPDLGPAALLEGEGINAICEVAGERSAPLGLLIDPADLPTVHQLCARHSETTFVIDHMARIGADSVIRAADIDALCAIAENTNACVKVSAFWGLGEGRPPYTGLLPLIERVYRAFGGDRVMWGSDAPFQCEGENTYTDCTAFLVQDLSQLLADDYGKLVSGNAKRIYRY